MKLTIKLTKPNLLFYRILSSPLPLDNTLALVGYSLQASSELIKRVSGIDLTPYRELIQCVENLLPHVEWPALPSFAPLLAVFGLDFDNFKRLRFVLYDVFFNERYISVKSASTSKPLDVIQDKAKGLEKMLPAADKMAKMSALISDVRIFNRLWGMLPLFDWFFANIRDRQSGNYGSITNPIPPPPKFERYLNNLKLMALLVFQPLENLAYLGNHKIISMSKKTETKLWNWSSRFWAFYVVLELVRLSKEFFRNLKSDSSFLNKLGGGKQQTFYDQINGMTKSVVSMKHLPANWYKDLIINLCYLPLTAHWSTERGLISDFTVGALGATAAATSIGPQWVNVVKGRNL